MSEEEKKYPCLFRLIDECQARKFVEESYKNPMRPDLGQSDETAVVERAMDNTKGVSMDDRETMRRLGEDIMRGIAGPMIHFMQTNKASLMGNYCGMCPTRINAMTSMIKSCPQPPHEE